MYIEFGLFGKHLSRSYATCKLKYSDYCTTTDFQVLYAIIFCRRWRRQFSNDVLCYAVILIAAYHFNNSPGTSWNYLVTPSKNNNSTNRVRSQENLSSPFSKT